MKNDQIGTERNKKEQQIKNKESAPVEKEKTREADNNGAAVKYIAEVPMIFN